MIKRNLVANYIGQAWSAIMSIAFIPLYIKHLGIESYGLIGLFGMLLTWLGLLDLGMTPTLSREMARFIGGAHTTDSIRTLLRTIEILSIFLAIFIFISIWVFSEWMANHWLKAEKIHPTIVAEAFSIMGLVTALRFIENIYRSAILGLQKHIIFNVVNIFLSTLRGLGAVAVLVWISNSIRVYFIWQGIISILTLFAFLIITYYNLPNTQSKIKFSFCSLKGIGNFAGGILGISLLSLLLTQVDKVLLSKLLSLSDYGYYTLAAVSAGSLFLIINPISQSWSPKLAELQAIDDTKKLNEKYHQGAQLITVIMGSATMIFVFFADKILLVWTGDATLASKSSNIFRLLSIGNLFNGLNTMPYLIQMAYGWTSLVTRINIFAVLIIIPLLILITPIFGADGAAAVWLILNAGYILIGVHFMFRKILITEKWNWFLNDIAYPIFTAALSATICFLLMPSDLANVQLILFILVSSILVFVTSSFSSFYMRNSFYFMFDYARTFFIAKIKN